MPSRGDRVDGQATLTGSFRVLLPYVAAQRRGVAASVVVVVAGTVLGLLQPWPLKYLFDEVLIPGVDGASVRAALVAVVAAILAIAVGETLLGYAQTYLLSATGQKVAFAMRTDVYRQVQRQSLGFHDRQRTGDLVTRVTDDVDEVQELLTEDVVANGSNLLTVVGMLGVLLVLDWQLSLAMVLFVPAVYVTNLVFRRRIKARQRDVRRGQGDVASLATETLSSMRVVKAFGRERVEDARFGDRTRALLEANLHVVRSEAAFAAVMAALTAGALAAVVWLGAQRVLAGALTPGDLLVFITYLRGFYGPVRALSKFSAQVAKVAVSAEKVAEVLREQPAVRDLPGARPAPRFRGEVEFRDVSFAYEPSRPALRHVSFTVAPGQVVALVGATGAGKSTVAALLARLYDPTEGSVRIDGHDVRDYTLETLQAQIGFVLQEALLFRGSVRDNIAYGHPGVDDDGVVAAARVAQVHDFVQGLPEGYDTVVGERGDTLSGGQRQRIAIARAVVRDSPVLVLDEPTAGLDARSEAAVLDSLDRVMTGRTTLVIAHRLATVRRADLILVLHEGEVTERGRHEELLALGGRYAELCRLQGLLERDGQARSAVRGEPRRRRDPRVPAPHAATAPAPRGVPPTP